MYKVLIAEDEILVRLGLANSINWEKLDMILVAQASNGVQAFELFQKERPDIVITDIRMPLMDGMTLIQKIREIDSRCKIVIITCVEEFSYARQAIACQVEDYILKLTMDMNEIEALLANIRKKLDVSGAVQQTSPLSSHIMDTRTRQELYDCLRGYGTSVSYNSLTSSFFSEPFQVAFIRVLLKKKELREEAERSRICADKSIFQLLRQHLEHDGAILVENTPGEYFLLFHRLNTFHRDFKAVITLTEKYYNSRPICGISPVWQNLTTVSEAADAASSLLARYFFSPEQLLFTADSPDDKERIKDSVFLHTQKIFLDFSGSCPGITDIWNEYDGRIRQLLSDFSGDCNDIRKLFYYLADWLQESLSLNNNESADNCVYNYRRYIFDATDIQDIYYIFERLLNKFLVFTVSSGSLSREMQEIIRYIEKHYAENLSLEDLSAQVNYSKGYLCSIFRRELNTSFGNYLSKVRISHAKKLLTTSFLRLYEIAEQTGFYDYSHFARTFKKYTGFSPQEYQNHQAADIQEGTLI